MLQIAALTVGYATVPTTSRWSSTILNKKLKSYEQEIGITSQGSIELAPIEDRYGILPVVAHRLLRKTRQHTKMLVTTTTGSVVSETPTTRAGVESVILKSLILLFG